MHQSYLKQHSPVQIMFPKKRDFDLLDLENYSRVDSLLARVLTHHEYLIVSFILSSFSHIVGRDMFISEEF